MTIADREHAARGTAFIGRRRRLEVAVVALVAWSGSAVYSLVARPRLLPISDATTYRLLGSHLADDLGYVRPFDLALRSLSRPTAEFPPGFPTVLGALDLAGVESLALQRLALGAAVAVAAGATVLMARRWFASRTAVALGLVVALHPTVIVTPASMGSESVYLAATAVTALQVLRWWERPTVWRAVAAGAAGGVAAMIRTEALALALILVVLGAVAGRRRAASARWTAGVALLALAVLPGAWAFRNAATFEEPVLGSTNFVTAISGSYCPASFEGPLAGYWQIGPSCFPGFDEGLMERADESVAAAVLRTDAVEYARSHLGDLPRVAVIRVLRTFHLWDAAQQARLASFEGRRYAAERLSGAVVAATIPAAAWGVTVLLRRRAWAALGILVVPVVVVLATVAVTYGNARFRIGADIPLVLLAATGVADVAGRWRARPGGRAELTGGEPEAGDGSPTR